MEVQREYLVLLHTQRLLQTRRNGSATGISSSATDSKKLKSDDSSRASEIGATSTREASGDHYTIIISPNKKSDKLLKISKTKVNMSFRVTKEIYTNLLSQIS